MSQASSIAAQNRIYFSSAGAVRRHSPRHVSYLAVIDRTLRVICSRDGEEIRNEIATDGDAAARLACLLIAGIAPLRHGDSLRVTSADSRLKTPAA